MKDDDLHFTDDLLVVKALTTDTSTTTRQKAGQGEPQEDAPDAGPKKKRIRVAVGLCHTPSQLKLRLPPVKGCRIQLNVDRYQVTYPVKDQVQSKSFSSNFLHAGSKELALKHVENWAWDRYADDVTHKVAQAARIVQMQLYVGEGGESEFH